MVRASGFGLVGIALLGVGCLDDLQTSTTERLLYGAVFTSTVDGDRVNANIYDFKEDVYLDGGGFDRARYGRSPIPWRR